MGSRQVKIYCLLDFYLPSPYSWIIAAWEHNQNNIQSIKQVDWFKVTAVILKIFIHSAWKVHRGI